MHNWWSNVDHHQAIFDLVDNQAVLQLVDCQAVLQLFCTIVIVIAFSSSFHNDRFRKNIGSEIHA